MGRTRKPSAALESARDAQDGLGMGTDIPAVQEAAEGAANGQIIGSADPAELLGCQEEAEPVEGVVCCPYVVTAENGLNLRMKPSLDADILGTLPCGAGVFAEDGPAQNGWRQVSTGRLSGWMLAQHLEPL